jgi:DNA helicase-2/ATP-dependent DNA helicase PcrA
MFKKGERILKDYLRNAFDAKHLPLSLEFPFQFRLAGNAKTLKIAGKIDRIDKLGNGKIEIVDYKTGTNEPDEKSLLTNLQLTVYALAATEIKDHLLGKKPTEVVLSLYFLESGKKYTAVRTEDQLSKAKEELLATADEIAQSDFACSRSSLCFNCEFKMLCNS